ncbi:MAG: PAS domain-containing protein [Opitutaceae bacterium]|jgi:PAS domain S-box-containing protein
MKTPRSFTLLAEQMADAVILTDTAGRVSWINPAFTRLCGYSLKELKGQKPGPLLQGPDTAPKAIKVLHTAIHRGRKASVELVNYHKNSEPYSVWISLTPIKNRAGKITGFMAIERETTAMQCELRKLENEIAQFYEIICQLSDEQSVHPI